MKDAEKTQEQLINELVELRQRFAALESSQSRPVATANPADIALNSLDKKKRQPVTSKPDAGDFLSYAPHEKYQRLLTAIPDLILRIDQDGTCLECFPGQGFEPLVLPDQLSGRNLAEMFPPEVAQQARHHLGQALKSGQMQRFEFQLSKNKDKRIYEARLTVCDDQAGQILALVRDITEQKQAEEALRESEKRFRQVTSSISDHIYMTEVTADGEYVNLYLSPHIEALTGYPREKAMADWHFWPSYVIHPEDRAAAAAQARQLAQGHSSEVEYRMVRADGEIIWVRDSARVQRQGTSKIIYGVVSNITERKRAEAALKYAERLKVLHEIDQAILSAQSPQAIAQVTLDHIQLLVPCQRASVLVFNFETEEAVLLAININGETQAGEGRRIPRKAFSSIPQMWQGQPGIVEDMLAIARPSSFAKQLLAEGIRAYISVPLISRDLIGTLNLGAAMPGAFSVEDIDILREVADQLAVAILQARLHTEMQRRARELAALNKASRAMASTLELNRILEQAMAEVRALLEAEGASVLLHDEASNELVFAAVAGPGAETLVGTRLPLTTGIAGWALRERRPILVDDAQHNPHFYGRIDAAIGLTTRSLLAVPLIFEDRVMGVVEAINKASGVFDQHDLELLEGLTSSAALAIDRAKLFEAEHHQRKIAETLGEVARVVNSSLELTKVLDRVLLELEKVIPYDSAAIMLLEQETLHMMAGRGFGDQEAEMSQPLPLKDMPAALKAIHQRHWIIVSDTAQEPLFAPAVGRSTAIRCVIAIPLISREEVIGLLTVDSRTPHRYSGQDAAVVFRFAQQVAVAIENARLYEDLQDRMRALQQAQAQLIHSEKMAALGRLVASIAHEINNPLQSVQTCLTLTREELDNDRRRDKLDRYLGIVESQIDHISTIVRRMRDFYRPARQEWHPTDLHSVLADVLELTEKQLQHSYITVERDWAADLPQIQANADYLKQVFLNLVLNAIDAMPQGGKLHIRTRPDQIAVDDRHQPLPAVCLEFSDTGDGMSSETLAHLFEPFFTTKRGGSGLGLSISHGIIKAHKGHITVTSQAGQGTTFTILLPVEQPSNEALET